MVLTYALQSCLFRLGLCCATQILSGVKLSGQLAWIVRNHSICITLRWAERLGTWEATYSWSSWFDFMREIHDLIKREDANQIVKWDQSTWVLDWFKLELGLIVEYQSQLHGLIWYKRTCRKDWSISYRANYHRRQGYSAQSSKFNCQRKANYHGRHEHLIVSTKRVYKVVNSIASNKFLKSAPLFVRDCSF